MDNEQNFDDVIKTAEIISDDDRSSAVNSLILEYYKKFGKKRDLEQFFSLSTAQSEIRDPNSLYWQKIKALSESSDSGDKKSESSTDLCKISIRCSVPKYYKTELQEGTQNTTDTDSAPIITEEVEPRHSDNESVKSDDVHSLKSVDGTLDLSMNKPHSPTSSVTSQRKLEWDSLADVGYGNESDKKVSASSLSTLERLALQQQFSINDTQQSNLGLPTAQSTPLDPNNKSNSKKDLKKIRNISNKEVDFIEMTLPQIPEASQAINLNLTKHITFNVDSKGDVSVEKNPKDDPSLPKKVSVETYMAPEAKFDKEIQTSLLKKNLPHHNVKNPVCVNLNTLKKRNKKKKFKKIKRKSKSSKEGKILKEPIEKDKNGEQISAAESFEYMPGHIYNQNHINNFQHKMIRPTKNDNKSSLESSTGHTTDSSKEKNSFTKDLEKSIDLLKITLKRGNADDEIKKKLIKEIVQRLLSTRYKDDESTDFLSGLSFDSKKLDLGATSTSTSDCNNTAEYKFAKPKKSILRNEKFNSKLPSTTQSTPNLPSTIKYEKTNELTASITDSDHSRNAKTSSEELYQKYLKALKREQAYRLHLKDKASLFKQKLVGSEQNINQDVKDQSRIKDLMKDLVRNNYDDGSGDASKMEGGSFNNENFNHCNAIRSQKSHSVFTLSSSTSNRQQKTNTKNTNIGTTSTGSSKNAEHYCCCPLHTHKVGVTDSSVQVNLQSSDKIDANFNRKQKCNNKGTDGAAKLQSNIKTNELKYVCLCKETDSHGVPDNILIYKCSRLETGYKGEETVHQSTHCCKSQGFENEELCQNLHSNFKTSSDTVEKCSNIRCIASSKSSQTNLDLDIILRQKCDKSGSNTSTDKNYHRKLESDKKTKLKTVREAVRWTQTDISINPRISDPSFSDINIIHREDCARLVSEQSKEVSLENIKTSSDELTELITDSSAKTFNRNSSSKLTSDTENKKADKETQSQVYTSSINNVESQYDLQNKLNYSIPIEGTNMTLKVSLGDQVSSDMRNPPSELNKRSILKTKETLTLKPTTTDISTSLLEECSVGVQSTDNNIFDEFYKQSVACPCKEVMKKKNEELTSEIKPLINCQGKFHTYPKGDKINQLKPLLRSNTDTSRIEKASHVTFDELKKKLACDNNFQTNSTERNNTTISGKSSENKKESQSSKSISDESQAKSQSSRSSYEFEETNDPLIELIQNITKKYSKKEIERSKRKKCFKEIITVLNYLLDTEECSDQKTPTHITDNIKQKESQSKEFADKAVQLTKSKRLSRSTEHTSSDLPTTSTESTTCHVLNKIKKECERYHQRRSKSHLRKVEESSSTSMNCDHRREYCYCKGYKCKQKQIDKTKKKCLAYNLIVQSDSLASEDTICETNNRPLRNIIVKVPKKKYENVPLKEMCAKMESKVPHCSRVYKTKSLPNNSEASSTEDTMRETQAYSVRDYLERNRPDFVEKCSQRQNCLKIMNETRASERATKRELLSMQVGRQQTLSTMSDSGLKMFAAQFGKQLRTKKLAPKFISERDMKKHSMKIYKSLPEVVNKIDQKKKESSKKTNLLLASIFKRNLQKKTLQGAVNLSNYSTIIKI